MGTLNRSTPMRPRWSRQSRTRTRRREAKKGPVQSRRAYICEFCVHYHHALMGSPSPTHAEVGALLSLARRWLSFCASLLDLCIFRPANQSSSPPAPCQAHPHLPQRFVYLSFFFVAPLTFAVPRRVFCRFLRCLPVHEAG